jgi:dTDP-4-dehydrorhamnose 3,5-epimerase
MIFTELSLPGAFVVDIQPLEDERGFFARGWCRKEFEAHGLASGFVQRNIGFSPRKGTLRGGSRTFKKWHAVELTADNHRMIYVPEGFAHGYLTVRDESEIYYDTTCSFVQESARGVRFDDPAFGIDWPAPPSLISDKDRSYPDFPL